MRNGLAHHRWVTDSCVNIQILTAPLYQLITMSAALALCFPMCLTSWCFVLLFRYTLRSPIFPLSIFSPLIVFSSSFVLPPPHPPPTKATNPPTQKKPACECSFQLVGCWLLIEDNYTDLMAAFQNSTLAEQSAHTPDVTGHGKALSQCYHFFFFSCE